MMFDPAAGCEFVSIDTDLAGNSPVEFEAPWMAGYEVQRIGLRDRCGCGTCECETRQCGQM
jgi:hypothetical protein